MISKTMPFSEQQIEAICAAYPTPFYLYDERGIRADARALLEAFGWAPAFKEFFAIKATPNPYILTILRAEGCGADASSYPELLLAVRAGITGEEIMFTSNDTPAHEFRLARELGAIINLDDLTHLPFLERHAGVPDAVSFRYNLGPRRPGNAIIGSPAEAKYGLTYEQLFEGYAAARATGLVLPFHVHEVRAQHPWFNSPVQHIYQSNRRAESDCLARPP